MKKIFICSPFRGDVPRNIRRAQEMCLMAFDRGHAPYAPHLLYPAFLDDNNVAQREAGMAAGLSFIAACDQLWFYDCDGQKPTEGMSREIERAKLYKIPVISYKAILGGHYVL